MTSLTERAVLAGGCFWGMQDLIRRYQRWVLPKRLASDREPSSQPEHRAECR